MTTLQQRALTATVFVVVMLVGLFWNVLSFEILFTVIGLGCLWEFTLLALGTNVAFRQRILLYTIGTLFYFALPIVNHYVVYTVGFCSTLSILASLFLIGKLFLKPEAPLSKPMVYFLSLFYIVFPFFQIQGLADNLYNFLGFNPILVFIILLMTWANDTFAYLIGSKIGKTPLYPKISPKKTWEGTIGGAICCGVAAAILSIFLVGKDSHGLGWFQYLVTGFIVGVFGTIGDLVESMFKRNAGVKDSGSFMPGHGGFLDRFDAFLFVIPLVFFYIIIVRWF